MNVINLWGPPGQGKSTAAAGLFYKMKVAGYDVELVTEYAKDVVWEGRHNLLRDQLYLLAKQNQRLERLRGQVEWCITDSPILLVLAYTPDNYYNGFEQFTYNVWKSYNNINFLLERSHAYRNRGRIQTEDQAKIIEDRVKQILESHNQKYDIINNSDPAKVIYERICNNDV